MNRKQQQKEINDKLLYALSQLMEAQKIQQNMLNDLKKYMDKRDDYQEQTNRAIIELLTKIPTT